MWDTISKWWITWFMGGVGAVLGAAWAWVMKRLKALRAEQAANTAGTLALLKDRLFQACLYHLEKGYCDVHSRESLDALADAYFAMGGNGSGKELLRRVRALPFIKPEGDSKEDRHG